jgi:uncharacterized protein (UPF0276 family)
MLKKSTFNPLVDIAADAGAAEFILNRVPDIGRRLSIVKNSGTSGRADNVRNFADGLLALVSKHLAWSTHEGVHLNDLLPVPYNAGSLQRVCDHIDEMQTFLGRAILLENPSTYVRFESSDMTEIEFLSAVVRFTGCGLLLDVNNVYVSATNHDFDADDYIDAFPMEHVGEIHFGGHAADKDHAGGRLLIDSHGSEVSGPVWRLYARAVSRAGGTPTLIEWDNEVLALASIERASAARGSHHSGAGG